MMHRIQILLRITLMTMNFIFYKKTMNKNKSNLRIFKLILVSFCLISSQHVVAAVNCNPTSNNPIVDTIKLAPMNISTGADVPVGTIIYRGSWISKAPSGDQIICYGSSRNQEPFNFAINTITDTPPRPLVSTSTVYGANVYDSGIPGIGVVFTDGTKPIIHTSPTEERRLSATASNNVPLHVGRVSGSTRYIELIKTGPISPGSFIISSSNLPKLKITYDNINGLTGASGLPIISNILLFDGSVNINTETCTTPDVNVDLGTHDISEFTGVGSATAWVRTNLELTRCPIFYGYYNHANTVPIFNGNLSGPGSIPLPHANSISATFTPNTSVINAASGVMGLDTMTSPVASGIGIQLGWGEVNPVPFNLNTSQTMRLPTDGRSNISVPLYVRYIQTETALSPGKANGKVTFLINYN